MDNEAAAKARLWPHRLPRSARRAKERSSSLLVEGSVLTDEQHNGSPLQNKERLLKTVSATSTSRVKKHVMLTRGTTAAMARNAVFNTPELLESILLQLPQEDIVAARRVDKHFNAVIMTSPAIQRKLFILAEPVLTTWNWKDGAMALKENRGNGWKEDGTSHFVQEGYVSLT